MRRLALVLLMFTVPAWPQAASDARNLRGIWQVTGTAYRNLESTKGVVVEPATGKIPYLAAARPTVDRNFRDRASADTLFACFQPGIPRATLLPEPLQIF